jgi:AcrR family transcriptional regulator
MYTNSVVSDGRHSKRSKNLREEIAVAFRKPGRPREDRLARQNEIYLAVVPLLRRTGVRGLSMRAAAHAAYVSVGRLYYYFPSKRALVLHGLQPEAIVRFRTGDEADCADAIKGDPTAYGEALRDYIYELATEFILPAYDAAVELGLEIMLAQVRHSLDNSVEALMDLVRPLVAHLEEPQLAALCTGIQRIMLAILLDRARTPEQYRLDLGALIAGYAAAAQHPTPAEEVSVH